MAGRRKMKHERDYAHAKSYRDKHGKLRWRVRKKGRSIDLGAAYGSPDFQARYKAALIELGIKVQSGAAKPNKANLIQPVTVNDYVSAYYAYPAFSDLQASTRSLYRRHLDKFRRDRGALPLARMKREHFQAYLDTIKNPGAANMMLRMVRTMLRAVMIRHSVITDVTAGLKERAVDESIECWTEADIAAFASKFGPGTIQYTAMMLMLHTGAARSDAVDLGWKNLYTGADGELRLSYRRGKTKVVADMPVHADLAAIIASLPRDSETFLQTRECTRRTGNGLGNLMRKACVTASLKHCSAHGLRKALGRRLAESGCTAHEIMAVLAHKSLAEAQRYTETYQRKESATTGIRKVEAKGFITALAPSDGDG